MDEQTTVFKKKRDYKNEQRFFQESWTEQFFFIYFNGKTTCVICGEFLAVPKKFNVQRHYNTKHAFIYDNLPTEERKLKVQELVHIFLTSDQPRYVTVAKARKSHSFRDALHTELEMRLVSWINYEKSLEHQMNGHLVKKTATTIANELGIENFTATDCWVYGFKQRNGVKFRSPKKEIETDSENKELITCTPLFDLGLIAQGQIDENNESPVYDLNEVDCSVPSIRPRLKKGAKPVLQVGDEKSEVSKNSSKHLRSVKNESDVPHLHVANITVKSPENLSSPLRNARTKKKGKEAADPLDIKMDSEEIDTTQSSLPQNLQYVDPQTFIGSIMINEELQLLRARVAELEFQNLDLKNRNTELTTALTQAESEKKQLKAELDSALLANRKLNIVKHSLINTITNLGKNLGAGALPTLDPTLDMSDTIVGI